MKNIIIVILALLPLVSCKQEAQENEKPKSNIVYLSDQKFKELVFDYQNNKEWKYAGQLPCIIDFYADWCGPCKRLSPIIEELAKKYEGKIIVYKVDTDKEQVLAQNLGIQSLPTLLFCPMEGQPQSSVGLVPKEMLEQAIKDVLKVE